MAFEFDSNRNTSRSSSLIQPWYQHLKLPLRLPRVHVWLGYRVSKRENRGVTDWKQKGGKWRDEGERGRQEEKEIEGEKQANRKRKRGKVSLSAQTTAPCSIFDYHIIETVFTEICVCLSLSVAPPQFIHCDISHVAYTVGVKYSWGWEEGVMQVFFFFFLFLEKCLNRSFDAWKKS